MSKKIAKLLGTINVFVRKHARIITKLEKIKRKFMNIKRGAFSATSLFFNGILLFHHTPLQEAVCQQ